MDEFARLDPDDKDSLYFRAELLLLCGRIEEASATYETARKNAPNAKEWSNETTAKRSRLVWRVL